MFKNNRACIHKLLFGLVFESVPDGYGGDDVKNIKKRR